MWQRVCNRKKFTEITITTVVSSTNRDEAKHCRSAGFELEKVGTATIDEMGDQK